MRSQPRHRARPTRTARSRLRKPVAAWTAAWLTLVALFAVSAAPARATVPVANDDTASTVANTSAYINVLDNDSDPDLEPIQVTGSTDPEHGSVTCASVGICVYEPDTGYTGSDSFGYEVSDGVETANANVAMTVTAAVPGNRPPTAVDDDFTAGSGAWSFLPLLDNDSDPDSDTLQLNSATAPDHGTIDCSAGVYCVYVSDIGYAGPDAFSYVVADKRGGTDTGAVSLVVTPNHQPIASDDTLVTRVNSAARSVNVIANDSDSDGDFLTAELLAAPLHGAATCAGARCSYTPSPNYSGPDSFTYTASDGRGGTDVATVSVDVSANHAPDVVDEDVTAVQGVTLTISLLDNDSDADGDNLRVVDTSAPDNGDLSCDVNGSCAYTADDDFTGSDGFEYVVSDGTDTSTGQVQIIVTEPCPPARCIDNGTILLAVHPEGHLNVPDGAGSLAGAGPAGLTFLSTGNEATAPGCLCEGWGAADAASGVTGYVSEDTDQGANNLTVDSFDVTASTAQSVVTIDDTMRVTHDFHPSSVTPNLYEIDVTIENVTDEELGDIRYRRVTDWDIEPTVFNEYVTIQGGGASNLLFDSDHGFATANPLGDRPSIAATGDFVDSGPFDHGALFDFGFGALDAGGERSFTIFYGAAATESAADAALAAVDAQVYSLAQPDTANGATLGTPNTFMVAFSGVDGDESAPPVAVDDELTTDEGVPGSVDVLLNDSDPDGDELSVTTLSPPAEHGDVSCTEEGSCTYTPDAGFSGPDSFDYEISDGNGGSAVATVAVEVEPVAPGNADPVAVDDQLAVEAGVTGSVDVLANDSDPDEDVLSVTTLAPAPAHGVVSCTEAGVCGYTPDEGFSGADSFDYEISDGEGGTASATVSVEVAAVPGQLELTLAVDQVDAQYSDPVGPIAVTTSGADQATVLTATGLPAAVGLTDHGDGTGDIAGVLTVGEGAYDAAITATNVDQSASQALAFEIAPEQATVDYTGDLRIPVGEGETAAEVTLSALLGQQSDGSPGDITRARVYFDLYDASNSTMATPDLTVGPVAPSDGGVAATVAEVAAGSWTIVVRFDESNGYFTGRADQGVTIEIGDEPHQQGHVAKGYGKVADWSGRKHHGSHRHDAHRAHKWFERYGQFWFAYGQRDDGDVWGLASYSWQDSHGRRYLIRSGHLNRASFTAGPTGMTSTAKGMGNLWVVDRASRHGAHSHKSGLGRVFFRMDIVDGSGKSADRFALSIWKDGRLWHRVGRAAGSGDVVQGRITIT